MVKRKIVHINEERCTGCGECIPNCHEGALQIIDGKAKLVNEAYCDGLGNCLGECPEDAISIIEKEVEDFDFKKTNEHLKEMGMPTLKENPLEKTIKEAKPKQQYNGGCPGAAMRNIKRSQPEYTSDEDIPSALQQWPVQLKLLPPYAPFFNDSDLLVSADCVPFAYAGFHQNLLKGKSVVIGCPKLDDIASYQDKLTAIFKHNNIKSVTVALMDVPCCYGIYAATEQAIKDSGKDIKLEKQVISVSGELYE